MLKLSNLKIDPEFSAQILPLSFEELQQLEQNIIAEGRLLNPIITWNGYILDGQNTVEARRTCNGGMELPIRCKVFYGLTKEDEATLFAIQTGNATCLTAGERLRANLVAENPDALYFVGITSNAGVEFAYDGIRAPWKIYCIETAYELYKQYGCERLRRDASHHQRGVEGQCGFLPCRCNPGCGPLHLRIRGRVQPGAAGAAAGKDTPENHHAAGSERHRQFCKPSHAADSPHL